MKYHFRIHKEKGGFSAQCIKLAGCVTQGDSMEELHVNMEEALNLYIQEPKDSKDIASLPNPLQRKAKNISEVPVEPQIAFSFMVRYYRIKHGLTQQQAAKIMGFDTIYSYQ